MIFSICKVGTVIFFSEFLIITVIFRVDANNSIWTAQILRISLYVNQFTLRTPEGSGKFRGSFIEPVRKLEQSLSTAARGAGGRGRGARGGRGVRASAN